MNSVWNWPWTADMAHARLLVDVDAVMLLERSEPPFWQAAQVRMLQALAAHVASASHWWRNWLTLPAGTLTLATLPRLPVLRRADFRASVEALGALKLPDAHGKTKTQSTSGSTGVPNTFHVSEWQMRLMSAHYQADHVRNDRDLRLPLAAILTRFDPHPGEEHRVEPANSVRGTGPQYMRYSPQRTMREHAQWLARIDPAWLNTSPAVLSGMLDEYERGLPPPRNLRHILQIGETVWPALREQVKRVLGAKITDRYTCEEIGPIAFQCPHDETRYHVCVGNAIVEVVDDDGKPLPHGTPGSVLITGLHQWASPVIRYELGDVATLHATCTCGEKVPTLSDLLGRKRFLIRLASGERVYANIRAEHWTEIAPVREHRLTQYSPTDVRAELVLERPLTEAERTKLVDMLRDKLHAEFTYHVEQVEKIEWTRSHKRQDLVCLV